MSIERIYYCDGPENTDIPSDEPQPNGCPHTARTASPPPYLPSGIIRVEEQAAGTSYELHFCSWDCLMRYAATKPPVEYIPA